MGNGLKLPNPFDRLGKEFNRIRSGKYYLLGVEKGELEEWESSGCGEYIERANTLLSILYDKHRALSGEELRLLSIKAEKGIIPEFNRAYIEGKVKDISTLVALHENPWSYVYFRLKEELDPNVDYNTIKKEIPEVGDLEIACKALSRMNFSVDDPEHVLSKASSIDDLRRIVEDYGNRLILALIATL